MVIRLVSVADQMPLHEFHDVFRTMGWNGDLGYIVRVHGQEINSFRRKTRSKALHEFKLHRQEKFLYVCDTLHMWEWDVRVLDIQEGVEGDYAPVCLGGRGAAPSEFCGGPTGYCLMLKRQREGVAMSDPVRLEAGVQMLAEACPGQSARTWDLLRTVLEEGFQGIDRRLRELGSPYLFTDDEVRRLIFHAGRLGPPGALRPYTYSTLFGLLASTGLRISEALSLHLHDVTSEGLVIRETKFRKSRLVWLHETAAVALQHYLLRRRKFASGDERTLSHVEGASSGTPLRPTPSKRFSKPPAFNANPMVPNLGCTI